MTSPLIATAAPNSSLDAASLALSLASDGGVALTLGHAREQTDQKHC